MGPQRWATALLAGISVAVSAAVGACAIKTEPPILLSQPLYPVYTSTELIDESELIVHGTVESTRVEKQTVAGSAGTDATLSPQARLSRNTPGDTPGFVVTIVTVRVVETIKGAAAAGDPIEVVQMGGLYEGVLYVESGTAMMTADRPDGYLLFLDEFPGSPYALPNPQQSLFLVDADGRLEAVGGEISLPFHSIEQVRVDVRAAEKAAKPSPQP